MSLKLYYHPLSTFSRRVLIALAEKQVPHELTVVDMAALVHRDFAAGLKSARIWGTGVFDGQTVKRDHVLQDKDIVELHL